MSFTDIELKFLKAMTETEDTPIRGNAIKRLVARLEAAEDLILNHTISPLDKHDPRYEAWLKAGGK